MKQKQALLPRQYFNVLLALGIVVLFQTQIPFIRKELLGTPYVLVMTITALYGDHLAGALAVVVGSISAGFVSAMSWRLQPHEIIQIFGIFLAGLIIYVLAWRSRNLTVSNLSLSSRLDLTERSLKRLKSDVRVNKTHLTKASRLNHQLRQVVDNIMEDQKLWGDHVKREVKQTESRRRQR